VARIIHDTTAPTPKAPAWQESGPEVISIALDKDEVVAIVHATHGNHQRAVAGLGGPTSLNGAGGRVHALLAEVKRANRWL
jgi:hypothetical protein